MSEGTVLYIRPGDVPLISRVLEEAADDYRYGKTKGSKLVAGVLDEYIEVIEDQQ